MREDFGNDPKKLGYIENAAVCTIVDIASLRCSCFDLTVCSRALDCRYATPHSQLRGETGHESDNQSWYWRCGHNSS
jgi:hypothetical protein